MTEEFLQAVRANDEKKVTQLLRTPRNLVLDFSRFEEGDRQGLMWAALYGHTKIFTLLFREGWCDNLNIRDPLGEYIIFTVIINDYWDIFSFMVRNGARLDVRTEFGWTPLMVALAYNRDRYAKIILQRQSFISTVSSHKKISAIDIAWALKSPLFFELSKRTDFFLDIADLSKRGLRHKSCYEELACD